ncbi:MAG: hypothetical protein Q9197_002184 [Variospora fuerteventurae]
MLEDQLLEILETLAPDAISISEDDGIVFPALGEVPDDVQDLDTLPGGSLYVTSSWTTSTPSASTTAAMSGGAVAKSAFVNKA